MSYSSLFPLAKWTFHLRLVLPVTLVVVYCLYLLLLLCHHCGELGDLRPHHEKLTSHPCMKVNISSLFSSSSPHITLRSEGPIFSNSTIHICYLCNTTCHITDSFLDTWGIYLRFIHLVHLHWCRYCFSFDIFQTGYIMRFKHSLQRNKSSLKSSHEPVFMDHSIGFSKNSKQNKPRVLYTLHAHMILRLLPESITLPKFFKWMVDDWSLCSSDLYEVELFISFLYCDCTLSIFDLCVIVLFD